MRAFVFVFAFLLLPLGLACDSMDDKLSPAESAKASRFLATYTTKFPPFTAPGSDASPAMKKFLAAFGDFLAAARVPEFKKTQAGVADADAVKRQKEWVDRLVAWAEQSLSRIGILTESAKRVRPANGVERVAAIALTGFAMNALRLDWDSVEFHRAPSFLAGSNEALSYWKRKAESARVPNVDDVVATFDLCIAETRDSADATLKAWHDKCVEWRPQPIGSSSSREPK